MKSNAKLLYMSLFMMIFLLLRSFFFFLRFFFYYTILLMKRISVHLSRVLLILYNTKTKLTSARRYDFGKLDGVSWQTRACKFQRLWRLELSVVVCRVLEISKCSTLNAWGYIYINRYTGQNLWKKLEFVKYIVW